MTTIYVEFSDPSKTQIIAIFAGPQDPAYWPNQGTVIDTDPMYLSFIAPPVGPNIDGFIQAAKTAVGGILAAGGIPHSALLFAAIQSGQWVDCQTLLTNALSTNGITQTQYNAIKTAAAAHNIPVTL